MSILAERLQAKQKQEQNPAATFMSRLLVEYQNSSEDIALTVTVI